MLTTRQPGSRGLINPARLPLYARSWTGLPPYTPIMEIVVLHVADCPNVAVVLERIAVACGDSSVQVSTRLVETESEASTLGMRGSPTVLIDGHDVGGGGEVGIACQLHLPTVDNLRSAIDARR